jgi:predicted nucleic acid-binding protein
MTVPVFVDTNVLIYALDPRHAAKQGAAQDWLSRCWKERSGRVSVQVLNEFYVNLIRLNGSAFKARARTEMQYLMAWHPLAIDTPLLETAWHISDDTGFSHWDALIVAAAATQGCEFLLSEDLQHGRTVEGVRIVNPFLEPA